MIGIKNISVIVPVLNEEENIQELHRRLKTNMDETDKEYEVIYIDDGSTDDSLDIIKKLSKRVKEVKYISFQRNYGKGAAYKAGFDLSSGDVVITLDADLQDDPAEIPKLLDRIKDDDDVVVGWKQDRKDPVLIVIISYLSNALASLLMGKRLHDINCGLKAIRRQVIQEINFSGDLFRMIPLMAHSRGFKVSEVPVKHHRRMHGSSKYTWKKVFGGSIDMLTAIFLSKFATRPAHFFGIIGGAFFIIGFLADSYVTWLKITTGTTQGKIPLLLFGVLMLILGFQLISTGFLAELIVSKTKQEPYFVKEKNLHSDSTVGK